MQTQPHCQNTSSAYLAFFLQYHVQFAQSFEMTAEHVPDFGRDLIQISKTSDQRSHEAVVRLCQANL